jgi:hypothetical protein
MYVALLGGGAMRFRFAPSRLVVVVAICVFSLCRQPTLCHAVGWCWFIDRRYSWDCDTLGRLSKPNTVDPLLLPLSSSSCHGFDSCSVTMPSFRWWSVVHCCGYTDFHFRWCFRVLAMGCFLTYNCCSCLVVYVLALIFSDCFQIYRDLQVFKCHVCLKRIGAAA